MAKRDIVVIGASAGGLEALQQLVAELPADLPAAVFIVWHLAPGAKSVLPELLTRAGPLRAVFPADGDRIERGRICVAPVDRHLLLEQGYVRVTKGPKENRFRPAIDPLFRSAAYLYGPRVIGVVLSGALDDGTAGLWTIKLRGGVAIAQEPADAVFRSMPLSALENVAVDHQLGAAEIGRLVARLAREEAPAAPPVVDEEQEKTRTEIRIAERRSALEDNIMQYGELSPYSCPECHGVLTALHEGHITRFRCHTGHAFSGDALLSSTSEQVEDHLWKAVRALDEVIMLLNGVGEQLTRDGNTRAAEVCFAKAREAYERATALREDTAQVEPLTNDALQTAK